MLLRILLLGVVELLATPSFVSCQTRIKRSSTPSGAPLAEQTGIDCPSNDGADVMVGDEEFEVFCGYNITGLPQLFQYAAVDELECLDHCGAIPECVGATYDGDDCIGFSAPISGTAVDYTLVGADFVSFQLEDSAAVSSSSSLTSTGPTTVSSSFTTFTSARPSSASIISIDSSTSNLFSSPSTSPSSIDSIKSSSAYSAYSSSSTLSISTASNKPSIATSSFAPSSTPALATLVTSIATTTTSNTTSTDLTTTSSSSLAGTISDSNSLGSYSSAFTADVPSTLSSSMFASLLSSPIMSPGTASSLSAASSLLPFAPPTGGCPSIRTGRETCILNTICCDDRSHFSICVNSGNDPRDTSVVYMGSTAAGTHCSTNSSPNRIRADHEGRCTPDGSLLCSVDGQTFMRCVHGGWINFSGVAAGTTCVDGTIVASA